MKNQKEQTNKTEVPNKGFIIAKSTSIALFIVLITLGLIFLILSFLR